MPSALDQLGKKRQCASTIAGARSRVTSWTVGNAQRCLRLPDDKYTVYRTVLELPATRFEP
jgi:hypothetical protein